MGNIYHTFHADKILEVNPPNMRGIRHPMITNKYDIHDIGEIALGQRGMQVSGKAINLYESCLPTFVLVNNIETGCLFDLHSQVLTTGQPNVRLDLRMARRLRERIRSRRHITAAKLPRIN
jgi:hypothetical protein